MENIELRSEKVRNIIGKMPSVLVRYGISAVVFIFIVLIVGSYFFQFTPSYKAIAKLNIHPNETIIKLEIPADKLENVQIGSYAIISFQTIPNVKINNFFVIITQIDKTLFVNPNGAYHLASCRVADSSSLPSDFETERTLTLNAEIMGQKTSIFDWVLGNVIPF
jgi:hypothetical protein